MDSPRIIPIEAHRAQEFAGGWVIKPKEMPRHWESRLPDDPWPLPDCTTNAIHVHPPRTLTANVNLRRAKCVNDKDNIRLTYHFIELFGPFVPDISASSFQELGHGQRNLE